MPMRSWLKFVMMTVGEELARDTIGNWKEARVGGENEGIMG
mgnify:FL=1